MLGIGFNVGKGLTTIVATLCCISCFCLGSGMECTEWDYYGLDNKDLMKGLC